MKEKLHPKTFATQVSCACGANFTTEATVESIRVEICAACHPFFTGRQKFVDTAGRVEKFQAKFGETGRPETPKERKRRQRAEADAAEAAKRQIEGQTAENAEPAQAEPTADANG